MRRPAAPRLLSSTLPRLRQAGSEAHSRFGRGPAAAAKTFFQSANAATGLTPDRVTTNGRDSYPRAMRTGQPSYGCLTRRLVLEMRQQHLNLAAPLRGALGTATRSIAEDRETRLAQ
jgi:hypothetical protein